MNRIATMPGVMPGLAIETRGEMAPGALMEMEAPLEQNTVLVHDMAAGQAGAGAEALGMVETPDRGVIQKVADKMAGTSLGRKVLGTAVGLAGAGMAFGPAIASAESGSSTTTVVNTQTGVTTHSSHAWEKTGDHSQITVMGNDRIVSKAKVKQMEENGQCQTFNGKKVKIYTEGHNASNGTAFGRDYRKSEFCKTDQDFNGDGKKDWIRALCGNAAIIGVTPTGAIENVVWVEGKGKIKVHARSRVTAEAECTTSDGLASASAEGEGVATARGYILLKGHGQNLVKHAQKEVDQIIEQSISGKGMAKSKAFAVADAKCSEGPAGSTTTTTTTTETPPPPPPPPSVPPKDSTQGPGSNVPGENGGTGSGGTGNTSPNSVICYDTASSSDGDMNPATEGAVMEGTAVDQNDNCVGPAVPADN